MFQNDGAVAADDFEFHVAGPPRLEGGDSVIIHVLYVCIESIVYPLITETVLLYLDCL